MRTCTCPVGTYLTTIASFTCPESFGQIQKLIFQRASATAGYGSNTTTILRATWTTTMTAVDGTKTVVTPYVSGVTMEVGAPREFGSGNEVRNGVPIIFGTAPTKVTVKLYEYPESIIRTIKELECETLTVGFINELGYFGLDGQSTAAYCGFPVQSLHISDRMLGGFESPDYHELTFSMPSNWSEYFTIVDPTANFSALDL